MSSCKKISIEFEIPEVAYNIKSPSICNLCKPCQSVRDCISHILDDHLQELIQRTNYLEVIQHRRCCLREFEKDFESKDFVYHFGKKHGPVGFKTSGNYCFFVTHTPFVEPNSNLEHVERTMIFQTVPQDNYRNELDSKKLKIFLMIYDPILQKQLRTLQGIHNDHCNEFERRAKESERDEKFLIAYQIFDRKRSLIDIQLRICRKMIKKCSELKSNFSKYGCDKHQVHQKQMRAIEKASESIRNYIRHHVLIDERVDDGKLEVVEICKGLGIFCILKEHNQYACS